MVSLGLTTQPLPPVQTKNSVLINSIYTERNERWLEEKDLQEDIKTSDFVR